jgi:hypothetical protein
MAYISRSSMYHENRAKGAFFLAVGFESGKWQSVKGTSIPLSRSYMHGSQVAFDKR